MIWVKRIGLGAVGIILLVLFFQFIGRNFGGNFGYGEPVSEWPCNISDTVRDSGTRPQWPLQLDNDTPPRIEKVRLVQSCHEGATEGRSEARSPACKIKPPSPSRCSL